MSDIAKTIMDVAETIAKRANAADQPPFAEQIDALKALTAAYTAMQKHPIDETEPDEGFSFEKGVQEEDNTDGTVTPLRTRRRPGN